MASKAYSALQEALRDFYLRSQRTLDRIATAHGTSSARLRVLIYIETQGATRSADLMETFGFAPRTITEAIDALEGEGLVERTPDPVDRRVKRIALTAAGESLLEAVAPIRQRMCDQLFKVLNDQERRQLAALLGRLNERLAELEQPRGHY